MPGMSSFRRRTLILCALVCLAAPVRAKTIELDAATIAEIDAAFDAGTLTSEQLVQLCLARIRAYDRQGPSLHAVIALNPKALEIARALDAERKAQGTPLAAPRDPGRPQGQLQHRPISRPPADRCCSRDRCRPRTRFS